MTVITTYGATSGSTTNSTTSWSNSLTYNFSASDQIACVTYAVFWQGAYSHNNGAGDYEVQLLEGATIRSAIRVRPKEVNTPNDRDLQGGFCFFTAAPSPQNVSFSLRFRPVSSGQASTAHNGQLRIVRLSSNSVWSESALTEQSLTSNANFNDVTGSAVSLSGEFLVLISAECQTSDRSSYATKLGINVDGSIVSWLPAGSSSDSTFNTCMVAEKINASNSAKVQFSQSTSDSDSVKVRRVRLLALKVADYRNIFFGKLSSNQSGTQTTYQDALSLTASVSAGNHFVIGSATFHVASASASGFLNFLSAGVQLDEHIREGISGTIPKGAYASQLQRLENYSAGSRTWKIQRKSESSVTNAVLTGSSISIIDLDDGGSGAFPTPTPSLGTKREYSSMAQLDALLAGTINEYDCFEPSASFVASEPKVVTVTQGAPGAGAIIKGPPAGSGQLCQLKAVGVGVLNMEFTGWYGSADAVQGNAADGGGSTITNTTFYFENVSKFALTGSSSINARYGFSIKDCTDFHIASFLSVGHRQDAGHINGNSSRFVIYRYNVRRNAYIPNFYYYPGTNTAPQYDPTSIPGGATFIDGSHPDALQLAVGPVTDGQLSNLDYEHYGQGNWFSDAQHARLLVRDSRFAVAFPWHQSFNGTDHEFRDNVIDAYPAAYAPGTVTPLVGFYSTAGTGPWRGGRSTFNVSVAVSSGIYPDPTNSYGINLTSGTLNGGVVAAPAAPLYTLFNPTVIPIATYRTQPTYTALSAPAAISKPRAAVTGAEFAEQIPQGTWLTAHPPYIRDWFTGMGANLYWRFKINGSIVQGPTQGLAASVYQSPASNSNLVIGCSLDGVTWVESDIIAVGLGIPVANAWDPDNKGPNILLRSQDLTAKKSNFTTAFEAVKGVTYRTVDTTYRYYRFVPTVLLGSSHGFGFGNASAPLNNYVGSSLNDVGVFFGGGAYVAGGFIALSPSFALGDTVELGVKTIGGVRKLFMGVSTGGNPIDWGSCGDPNGAGTGWTLSLTGDLTPMWNGHGGFGETITIDPTGWIP